CCQQIATYPLSHYTKRRKFGQNCSKIWYVYYATQKVERIEEQHDCCRKKTKSERNSNCLHKQISHCSQRRYFVVYCQKIRQCNGSSTDEKEQHYKRQINPSGNEIKNIK